MNKPDNKRKRASQDKIKTAFLDLLKNKEVHEISVSEIVKMAEINRSTFYENYFDIYDLANQIKKDMFDKIISLYPNEAESRTHSHKFINLFRNIRENQEYYSLLLKLNFDFSTYYDFVDYDSVMKHLGTTENLDYHIEFFKAGMNAIVRKWLSGGCKETPEEINDVLVREYRQNEE